jgi:hypothetical protein
MLARKRDLCSLASASWRLFEQPDVLDGDDGLVGEGGEEFYLLGCEQSDLFPREPHHANRRSFAQKRNTKHGAKSSNPLRL